MPYIYRAYIGHNSAWPMYVVARAGCFKPHIRIYGVYTVFLAGKLSNTKYTFIYVVYVGLARTVYVHRI